MSIVSSERERSRQADRWARRTLIIVCAAMFFSVLNGTMLNVALPQIGESLGVEEARLGWVMTGYLLIFGVATPFYGRLADLFGARRLFVLGLAIFSVASLFSALSQNFPMLLGARLIQATGAAAIPGLGMALISSAYPPERRGSAMGVVTAVFGTAAAIGPTLGGFITGLLGWNYLFLLSALSGLLIPIALRVLPVPQRRGSEGLDLPGGVLVALTVGGALLAATEGSRGDWTAPVVLGSLATSVIAGVLLTVRQRLARFPFVPRDLVHNRRYLTLITTSFSSMAFNGGTWILLPLMLADVYGLEEAALGVALIPNALTLAVLGPIAGRLVDRMGPGVLVTGGLSIMAFTGVIFSAYGAGAPVWMASILAGLLGVGFAFVNSPLTTTVSLVVGRDRQASGLSINSMAFFLGGGFGTAIVAAVLTARAGAADALNPLHSGEGAQYSDAFLVLLAPLCVALALSLRLHRTPQRATEPARAPVPQPAASPTRE